MHEHWNRSSLEEAIEQDPALRFLASQVRQELSGDPGHDIHHCLRVAIWTLRLQPELSHPRIAIAAALLHDIVALPKNSPQRAQASELCAARARELLTDLAFDQADINLICDAITDHSFSRGAVPRTSLGRALQDADRLEALGAIGLFRTISTGTQMGADYFHGGDPWAQQRHLDDLRYTIDHFWTKLLRLPKLMLTSQGRIQAEQRAEFMKSFVRQLAQELGVEAPERRFRSADDNDSSP